ncbi:MAG: hypothetical protein IKZ21_01895, partial [Clostridia bacterium]|nr:hypothetical protein [Clostridia bacterium]
PYLNTRLALGENILFIAPDRELGSVCISYLEEELAKSNLCSAIWQIVGEEDLHGKVDADILVLTPGVETDENAFLGHEDFLKRLTTIVMLSAAEVLARDGGLLAALVHRLTTRCGKLQTVALSESIPPETANALRQVLNLQEDLVLCSGYHSFDNTHLILWNYEPAPGEDGKLTLAQDNLFGESGLQTYLGVGLPLASVALKYGVGEVGIVSRSATPYKAMLEGMKSHIARLSPYFEGGVTGDDLDRRITFQRTEGGSANLMVMEDSLWNLPLAMYNAARYAGGENSLIHIVSRPYMLRDYFAANAQRYLTGEGRINMISPSLANTGQSVAMKLLVEARGGGVKLADLLRRVREVAPEVTDADGALHYLRDMVLPERNGYPLEYDFAFDRRNYLDGDTMEYKNEEWVSLKTNIPTASLVDSLREVSMVVRGQRVGLGIPAKCMYQSFVPGQSFTHAGRLYRVTAMDAAAGILKVTESGDRLDAPVDYRQVRKYALTSRPILQKYIPVHFRREDGELFGYEASVYRVGGMTVDTLGYFPLNYVNPAPNLVSGSDYIPLSAWDRSAAARRYENTGMLSLRIFGSQDPRVALLLAVMLEEMMKTIFPYSYQCLAVCPVCDNSELYRGVLGSRLKDFYPAMDRGDFYPRVPGCVEVLIVEDSENETGMLETLLQNEQAPFGMLFDTILAYLRWLSTYEPQGNITGRYLWFGGEDFPELFDRETLQNLLSELETVVRKDSLQVDCVPTGGRCSYCGRILYQSEYIEVEDHAGGQNRKLCHNCASLRMKDQNELVRLYEQVRIDLSNRYGVTIAGDIHIRFATAETIRARMQTGDQRVVLGFA